MLKLLLVLLFSTTAVFASNHSIYTSIKDSDCMVINSSDLDENPEIDYYSAECAGIDGYQIIIRGGDLRYDLGVKYNNKTIRANTVNSFHNLGSNVIEWRYKRTKVGSKYIANAYALIYRINHVIDEHGNSSTMLVVLRLDGGKSCHIASVLSHKNMNVTARIIADDPTNVCKNENN